MTARCDRAPPDVSSRDTDLIGTVRHVGRPPPDDPLNAPWPVVEHLATQRGYGCRLVDADCARRDIPGVAAVGGQPAIGSPHCGDGPSMDI